MKLVPLREFPGLKTAEIIKAIVEQARQGVGVGEIRARCRVLDALEKGAGPAGLALEDADHATLVRAVNGFEFGIASKDLLTIIDDILDANAAPSAPAAAPVT